MFENEQFANLVRISIHTCSIGFISFVYAGIYTYYTPLEILVYFLCSTMHYHKLIQ
jgi:hypothetical protein